MDLTNKTKNPRDVRTVKGYLGKKCLDSIHETENIEEERDSSGYRQQWPHPRLEWSVLPLAALQCPRVQLNRYWAGDARWASRKAADTPQIAEERERVEARTWMGVGASGHLARLPLSPKVNFKFRDRQSTLFIRHCRPSTCDWLCPRSGLLASQRR